MKRIFISLIVLSIVLCLSGCGEAKPQTSGETKPQSSDDLMLEMKEAYIEQFARQDGYTVDDIKIESHGEFDGCQVCFVDGIFGYVTAYTGERVAGFDFKYPTGQKFLVYKDGVYKNLQEAYDAGWLSEEALEELHTDYKKSRMYLYD